MDKKSLLPLGAFVYYQGDMRDIEMKTNANGDVYYTAKDDEGRTIYSFTPAFEDYWTQEEEDFHNQI